MPASDASRAVSLDEIRALPIEEVDKITALLPLRRYLTPKAPDGTSIHIIDFAAGCRFEVIYGPTGEPVDFRAENVRFLRTGDQIIVMPPEA
jgi:hypothetical protein